jgi:hypothetical protein
MRASAGAPQSATSQFPQCPQWPAAPPAQGDPLLRAMTDMMTDMLNRQHPTSAAEALKALRHRYPDIPLALRIAALRAGARNSAHNPK